MYTIVFWFFFFFQAEDGIRDLYVTGVQTCALPISGRGRGCTGSGPKSPSVVRRPASQPDGQRAAVRVYGNREDGGAHGRVLRCGRCRRGRRCRGGQRGAPASGSGQPIDAEDRTGEPVVDVHVGTGEVAAPVPEACRRALHRERERTSLQDREGPTADGDVAAAQERRAKAMTHVDLVRPAEAGANFPDSAEPPVGPLDQVTWSWPGQPLVGQRGRTQLHPSRRTP